MWTGQFSIRKRTFPINFAISLGFWVDFGHIDWSFGHCTIHCTLYKSIHNHTEIFSDRVNKNASWSSLETNIRVRNDKLYRDFFSRLFRKISTRNDLDGQFKQLPVDLYNKLSYLPQVSLKLLKTQEVRQFRRINCFDLMFWSKMLLEMHLPNKERVD